MRLGHDTNNRRPLTFAVTLFIFLFVLVVLAAVILDFSRVDLLGLLFLTIFVCCALIAKSVYDSLVVDEQIARTEEQIAKNIAISSEELHTQLFQNSPVPYLLLDKEGIVTSANLAAARLYGVAQADLDKLDVFKTFFSEEDGHVEILLQKYKGNIPVSSETIQVSKQNGDKAWALLSLFQFKNAYGERIGLLTLVDITRQKQIENAKAEFVSLASHQLRTPIAAIKWSAELLQLNKEQTLTDKQKRYVDRLLSGVERMVILVDDFLRVSRFELGTFQPEYSVVKVRQVLEGVLEEQAEKVKQKNLEVKLFVDGTVDTIETDKNLLRMVISNLFSNAVKYTSSGGTIHIGCRAQDEALHFSVADNGMGIPIKDQEQIFTKLYRASNAARNEPDGTGLGLYIAKEAVGVLRGKISFTSVENMSTTFDVTLPLKAVV